MLWSSGCFVTYIPAYMCTTYVHAVFRAVLVILCQDVDGYHYDVVSLSAGSSKLFANSCGFVGCAIIFKYFSRIPEFMGTPTLYSAVTDFRSFLVFQNETSRC